MAADVITFCYHIPRLWPVSGSLRQAQAVLDRLYEELSGERAVRTTLRQYLNDWFDGKKA
jgi:hypothetical protein